MDIKSLKSFKNGKVYALKTYDGYPVEVTDTFLPFYTKNAINENANKLQNNVVGDRSERWMIGVSCMSGCPVKCKFCATGSLKKYRNLTAKEIVEQVMFVIDKNPEYDPKRSREFKINYTRMGEPFLNISAVIDAITIIDKMIPNTHHYISTIGIKNSDFSWIKDNVTLQLSVHSLKTEKRNKLIPFKNKLTYEEMSQIRTKSNLKTTLNMTLVDEDDFDIVALKELFDPEFFFVKLSPINPNTISEKNKLGNGFIEAENLI